MTRGPLLIDAGIAVLLAALLLIVSPGLAVVGLVALLLVVICLVSFALERARRHRLR